MSTPAGQSALRPRAAYQALEDHHERIGTSTCASCSPRIRSAARA